MLFFLVHSLLGLWAAKQSLSPPPLLPGIVGEVRSQQSTFWSFQEPNGAETIEIVNDVT